ncbi:MAG: ATP-binding protein [Candidatus Dormibacteraeota bacterium]|nr:ATP-binding protein [Candidatus Dormibacteraeota bacterium]
MISGPEQTERIDAIAEAFMQLISGNTAVRLLLSPKRDELDAIVVGFNWLAEELGVREEANRQLVSDLERSNTELGRTNAELEQFAYIASHDLQEPLRMVGSYTSLLKRRYAGKLDADADEFIRLAQEGVIRMRSLINDLLIYSRLGREDKLRKPVDSRVALDRALAALQPAVDARHATIRISDLPMVMGNEGQLARVFQNLVDNGIKFSPGRQPEIRVDAERRDGEWVFSVRDNGIGILPQYRDRIFLVFQRLNKRDEYAGTGMGLAICKKIVERYGGKIWFESEPGTGATFRFSLLAMDGLEMVAA